MGIIETISSVIIGLRIPLGTASGISFIFTTILLFSPKELLYKLSIQNFLNTYNETISLVWLISLSVLIFYIICFTKDTIASILHKRNQIKTLKSLTNKQKQIVLQAYQNGGEIRLPFDNAQANFLMKAHILHAPQTSYVESTDNFSINYYLSQWVIEYIENDYEF